MTTENASERIVVSLEDTEVVEGSRILSLFFARLAYKLEESRLGRQEIKLDPTERVTIATAADRLLRRTAIMRDDLVERLGPRADLDTFASDINRMERNRVKFEGDARGYFRQLGKPVLFSYIKSSEQPVKVPQLERDLGLLEAVGVEVTHSPVEA